MKWDDLKQHIGLIQRKFGSLKYAILILLIGIVLMALPNVNQKDEEKTETLVTVSDSFETKLEDTLRLVDGAGNVRVLLTLQEDNRYTYQMDVEDYKQTEHQERIEQTVLVRDRDGSESAVIVGVEYPVYKGAVVICEGADSAAVRLHITKAVSDLTGLGSDKISVIKMQSK